MDFKVAGQARGGEYIFHIRWSCNSVSCPNQIRISQFRPAHRFVPNFWFWKVKANLRSKILDLWRTNSLNSHLSSDNYSWNHQRTNYLCLCSDPYTGGDTKKRTVVRKLIPFVDRLERWFLVVSDSRIQTGRKIIMEKKIRDSLNGLSLKERKRWKEWKYFCS